MNTKAWQANLSLGNKMTYLGAYASKQEAGIVWNAGSVWRRLKEPGKRRLKVRCARCS